MDTPAFDWSRFTLKIGISTDLERIFNAWTSQLAIESWFLSKAEFTDPNGNLKTKESKIGVGDTYEWEWYSSDYVASGEVISIDDSRSLSFTFLGCVVQVSFYEEAGETIVKIEQSSIPTDEASIVSFHVGCTRGWTFYLANLKSLLEGGLDLRNKNKGLKGVVNA